MLDSVEWQPQNVTYDRVETRIDSANSDGSISHYSLCVFLDADSQAQMLEWVGEVEDKIEEAGVEVGIR